MIKPTRSLSIALLILFAQPPRGSAVPETDVIVYGSTPQGMTPDELVTYVKLSAHLAELDDLRA